MTDKTTADKATSGFSADERAAMKERAKEMRAEAKRDSKNADGLKDLLGAIGKMTDADPAIAERIHAIVTEAAPHLAAKTWYGQPAWTKDGEVLCFFQSSAKFKTRYCTLGFNEAAALDDGGMWPTAFAIVSLSEADERRIADLVAQAARA